MRKLLAGLLIGVLVSAPAVLAAAPPTHEFYGAKVGRTTRFVTTSHEWEFNAVHFDTCGCFDPAEPGRLTIPTTGYWQVGAQVSVLGTNQSPASNRDTVLWISKDDNELDYIAADRLSNEQGGVIVIYHTESVVYLEAGEFVEAYLTSGKTVEVNLPGTNGSISPVMYVAFLGT